uniref:Uncharacterized protein n=1 Tax=Panagrolaimus sp. PS1159 TaxID=55785 RepID=A0AC35GD55_9BILA
MLLLLIFFNLSFASVINKSIHPKNYPVVNHKNIEQEAFQRIKLDENDDNNTLILTEKNVAAGNTGNIVGVTENGLFKPLSASAKKIITIQTENCGKNSFPHRFFIDESGKPMMQCEPHRCLKTEKIECRSNIQMQECNKSNEWIAGFIGKNNGTHDIMEVECCHYKDTIFTAFIKTFNVTNTNFYDHNVIVENEKLAAIDFINSIKKIELSKDNNIYSVSVYRMQCPPFKKTTTNDFDENIRDFANTTIDSKEKAELFASTLKYIIAELEKRSKFDNLTSDLQMSDNTNNDTASMQNHPIFKSITSKEEAVLQASAMRLVASELAKGPFGNVFSDINGSTTTEKPPRREFYHKGKKITNGNFPTYRLPFDDVHGPNYSTFDAFS